MNSAYRFTILFFCLLTSCANVDKHIEDRQDSDPLPSWKEGYAKKTIMEFVAATTTEGSEYFVPVADRIACFDNDGTLWSEQPMYVQLAFAIDRVRAMAPEHPEWKKEEPFKSVLEGDLSGVMRGGAPALMHLIAASHAGVSTVEFNQQVSDWVQTARHPTTDKLYTEMVFQPMIELLRYLQSKEYKTFIVSGGGIDFMRVWAADVYSIPSHQIIGSSIKTSYETGEDGIPELIKLPELNFYDDHEGKPVAIHQHIGKRPVLSFGNSDGDYEMLQWTTSASGYLRLELLLHHTDADREWAYDRKSAVGKLDKALNDAGKNGWIVVDMQRDWKVIYPNTNSVNGKGK